jgi:hypothetical protein
MLLLYENYTIPQVSTLVSDAYSMKNLVIPGSNADSGIQIKFDGSANRTLSCYIEGTRNVRVKSLSNIYLSTIDESTFLAKCLDKVCFT